MNSFIEEFPIRDLAEYRLKSLVSAYGLDPDDFTILYDAGARKWVLVYEP